MATPDEPAANGVMKSITARWWRRHNVQPEPEHMRYVSARWVNPAQGMPPSIVAVGDDGVEYPIPSEDSDVPPWPEYLAGGGTIAPADPTNDHITTAPDDLFGGPSLGEIYDGNS